MLPDDLVKESPDPTGLYCCDGRKWTSARFLHDILQKPPYRYHSITCALEGCPGTGYTLTKSMFVARMIATFKVDSKLCARLRIMYDLFEGSHAGAVDYRDILSCMTVLRRYREVRDNPLRLFRDLVMSYSNEAGTAVRRHDALRVVRMGGVRGGDVMQTSMRLDKYLSDEAGLRGLKATFHQLDITFLMDVIEGNPSVLISFRTQLWQRLPEAWRMGVLHEVEAVGFDKAGSSALGMKLRRASRWYGKTLSRRIMIKWKIFTNNMKQNRAQRAAVEKVSSRCAVRAWHATASSGVVIREHKAIAVRRGQLSAIRRFFNRMVNFTERQKALAALTWTCSKQGKLVAAGVGSMRGVLRKRSMRLALRAWCEAASLMNAWEFAVDLSEERLRRRVFSGFSDYIKAFVAARRLDDEAETRAAGIAEAVEEASREKDLLERAAQDAAKHKKAEAKAKLMAERAAAHEENMKAARAESVARDARIVSRQREVRRRRVYEARVRTKADFDAEWEIGLNENVEYEMEATKSWLESDREAPFKVQKELKMLKRRFYAAPTPETTELERSLRDPANAIFAHMANLLYKENKTLQTFFHQFDKEGDGYLAHEEFKGMVSSLNIKLSGEQIRSVIRAIDLDGGGYIDFPEFEAAVKRHEDVCGAAGSGWKMYVSPVHAIMILHNVETNEEIWDYKATDKDLIRVVKDNIVGLDGIEAKERAVREREQEWEKLVRDRAATTIQRQCHIRTARKKRTLLRWKWDVERAREKSRRTNARATAVQCWWRGLRAKWLALRLLQITVEVLWDPGSNQQYYFNHGLRQASWAVPSILRRWRGEDACMSDVAEWVWISRTFGQSYYYNTRSRVRQDEKPAGYMRCFSCRMQLATRRCRVEDRELCFACFRNEHLDGSEGCWHEWEPSKLHPCLVCGQRDARLVCSECVSSVDVNADAARHYGDEGAGAASEPHGGAGGGLMLCENCLSRTHAHPDVQHHQAFTVEQRAAQHGAGELVPERGTFEDDMKEEWEESTEDGVNYAGAEQFGLDLYQ